LKHQSFLKSIVVIGADRRIEKNRRQKNHLKSIYCLLTKCIYIKQTKMLYAPLASAIVFFIFGIIHDNSTAIISALFLFLFFLAVTFTDKNQGQQ
jgi:hypothetical protein